MPDPPSGLQGTVMAAVGRELSKPSSPDNGNGDWLSFAAAIAAVLLIGSNLALTAPAISSLDRRAKPTLRETLDAAEMLRQLSPDLSPAEAARMAVAFQAGGDLTSVPDFPATGARSQRKLQ